MPKTAGFNFGAILSGGPQTLSCPAASWIRKAKVKWRHHTLDRYDRQGDHHTLSRQYFAHALTRRCPSDSVRSSPRRSRTPQVY